MEKLAQFFNKYASSIGAIAGTSLALVSGEPEMKLIASAYSPVVANAVRELASEIISKHLPESEKVKTCAVLTSAMDQIRSQLDNGNEIRDDGFFDLGDSDRSDFIEFMEGVVFAVSRENQTKKIKFQGNLLANVLFDESVDADYANALVSFAERASYRQLCQIYIAVCISRSRRGLPRMVVKEPFKVSRREAFIEMDILRTNGLVFFEPVSDFYFPSRLWADRLKIHIKALKLFQLMRLTELDRNDIEKYASQLELRIV